MAAARALYTDWKNVYKRKPREKEVLEGSVPVSQFGRMCARLGIEIIGASSPQAKGRVERNHGTHQDRLVKKLRLRGICDYQSPTNKAAVRLCMAGIRRALGVHQEASWNWDCRNAAWCCRSAAPAGWEPCSLCSKGCF